MSQKSFKKNITVASLFTISFYFAPFLSAAVGNYKDMGNGVCSAVIISLYTALIIWFFSLILLIIIREPLCRWLRVVLLYLSVIFIVNATFLLWDFGPFNGSEVLLRNNLGKFVVEFFTVGTLFLTFFFLREQIEKITVSLSLALIIVILVPIAVKIPAAVKTFIATKSKMIVEFDFSDEKILSFSTKRNIFVFVVDALQTEQFLHSITNNPHIKKAFSGFVCFKNNSGVAPNTTFAIPAMMSGISYTGKIPAHKYKTNAELGKNSLPVTLRKYGYDVRLYSHHTIPYYPGIEAWDNLQSAANISNGVSGWFSLLRLSLYKVSPLILKLFFRNEKKMANIKSTIVQKFTPIPNPIVERFDDAALLDKISKKSKISFNQPVMRWFHLQGIHHPLTLISENEKSSTNISKAQLPQLQADRLLVLFAEMLNGLRKLGVFDSSTIIVLGDHGHSDTRMPAMLVKTANAKHELIYSEAPTSLTDLPATIISDIGIKESYNGTDMLRLDVSTARKRFYYEYFSIDKVSDLPRKITTQLLIKNENTASNWRTVETSSPALDSRKENVFYQGFTHSDDIDLHIVRGEFKRGIPGISWSSWFEIDIPSFVGKSNIVDILYYRHNIRPDKMKIYIDGVFSQELNTLPYSHLLLFIPENTNGSKAKCKTNIRFTCSSGNSENDVILFVDMLSTTLKNVPSSHLRPANSGYNCDKNAIWAQGGNIWSDDMKFLVVHNNSIISPVINRSNKIFVFHPTKSTINNKIEYFIADPNTGEVGPTISIDKLCNDNS